MFYALSLRAYHGDLPSCHQQEAATAGFSDAIAYERPFSLAMQLRSAGARAPVLHFVFRCAFNPHPSHQV